jgi:hypothetical protein
MRQYTRLQIARVLLLHVCFTCRAWTWSLAHQNIEDGSVQGLNYSMRPGLVVGHG